NSALQQVVQPVFTGPSATGQGDVTATFSGGGNHCNLTQAAYVASTVPPPASYTFPYGLLRFAMGNACDGSPVTVQVTYPTPLPTETKYWKYGKTLSDPTPHWYEIPATINSTTATFTLTDGGLGDDDLSVNGRIADDGGVGVLPASPPTDIPTLSQWAMLLLAGLLGLFGMRRVRRA
ncbi:MAG: IPTL-CTERM sorting domain-containing protein, partial [Candidatus Competibacteraceae bacterium]